MKSYQIFFLIFSCSFHILHSAEACAEPRIKKTEKPNWVTALNVNQDYVPAENEIVEGSFLILYELQVNVETKSEYHHFIRKLTNETGVQNNSQIEIRFDPSYQQLTFHHITIIRDGKRKEILDISKFKIIRQEKDLSRFLYNG